MAKNLVKLEIMTPSKRFYREDVELVIAPTLDGDEGFMAGHSWAVKLLRVGELWIQEKGAENGQWKVAAIAGGFIDVKDTIMIYTDAVEWADEIDRDRAVSERERAEEWLIKNGEFASEADIEQARKAIAKSEARVNVAEGSHRY